MLAADLTIFKDSIALEKIDWGGGFCCLDELEEQSELKSSESSNIQSISVQTSEEEQQRLFEHLNRKCQCGSGDIWSECNGIDGDDSYCG